MFKYIQSVTQTAIFIFKHSFHLPCLHENSFAYVKSDVNALSCVYSIGNEVILIKLADCASVTILANMHQVLHKNLNIPLSKVCE